MVGAFDSPLESKKEKRRPMPEITTEIPTPLTPMLSQYLEIKRQHADALLFYRMGDFYEMFFDDAVTAAPVLEVQLTSRDRNAKNPIPMCGVPHHAASAYVQKLIARGFKVAICEQVEDPKQVKGLVRREVIRVVTPALIGDPELVAEEACNILACLFEEPVNAKPDFDTDSGPRVQLGLLDLLRGEVKTGTLSSTKSLTDLFCETNPKEILIPEGLEDRKWLRELLKLFPTMVITRRAEYFIPRKDGSESITVSALKSYLKETQKLENLPHLQSPIPLLEMGGMHLDLTTLAALEVVKGISPREGKTLFDVLDRTSTPMGRRALREWLMRPLANAPAIEARLSSVENLVRDHQLAESLRAALAQIRDLERLTTKTALGLAMPRDLVAIRSVLEALPAINSFLKKATAPLLSSFRKRLNPLGELTQDLAQALEDLPPATLRDGGIFRDSYHPQIAELRSLSKDAKGTIAGIEIREKNRTGIPSLKVKYSRVFGYTIEITKAYLNKVPAEYHRKQTIAGGERFITEELKRFEEKVVTADHKLKTLEEGLFIELRKKVAAESPTLLQNARLLAELDVLLGFAQIARERGYERPTLHSGWQLDVEDGRHPVIETLLPAGEFVPNSIHFSEQECRTLIITGPNMAGKSTIMRQVALIAIMAHAGSFVPGKKVHLPVVDAIYTRIGSSDDLTRGRSTFMVEMTEVARILEKATPQSLILIDEIGRGTSTYDGLSLAWSLLEHIHTQVRAKTLFATHFHEVTALEKTMPQIRNANVLVEKWKNEIVFLHKLGPGICSQSYGIEVAKLAGLPPKVLLRAKQILDLLESQSQRGSRARSRALEIHENQLAFLEGLEALETRSELDS